MRLRRAVNLLAILLALLATARLILSEDKDTGPDVATSLKLQTTAAPTLRVYDLRDLWPRLVAQMQVPEDAKSKVPARYHNRGHADTFGPAPVPPPPPPTPQELAIRRIEWLFKAHASPEDWRDNGGDIAIDYGAGGFMFVWHTPEGHRQIQELLNAIRRADKIKWAERNKQVGQ
jgi:hypothetical protein